MVPIRTSGSATLVSCHYLMFNVCIKKKFSSQAQVVNFVHLSVLRHCDRPYTVPVPTSLMPPNQRRQFLWNCFLEMKSKKSSSSSSRSDLFPDWLAVSAPSPLLLLPVLQIDHHHHHRPSSRDGLANSVVFSNEWTFLAWGIAHAHMKETGW